MAPLRIVLHGQAKITRIPELCSILLNGGVEGTDRASILTEVEAACNTLQTRLKDHTITNEQNIPTQASPIVECSLLPILCRALIRPANPQTNTAETITYRAIFMCQVTFRNFQQMRIFANGLTSIPMIQIHEVNWHLTPATIKLVEKEVRRMAFEEATNRAKYYASMMQREVVPVKIRSHKLDVKIKSIPRMQAHAAANDSVIVALVPRNLEFGHRVKVTFGEA